ncbi:LysR family transcriptional regulator [Ostreiculturibacter nitratireducens]|uniref:LysR family transcriptional regulator n=1 Tax=Ostreiculturibacter nitratireducens TaxID=3075226 RepID=UPI0031B5C06A
MASRPQDPTSTARALEWNDLALILAICRAESLSGAARFLGQTHSTVFRRINAIEEKTGVRFFDRFRHGYVMTDAGRTAMEYGERIESEFHALGLEVLGRDEKLRGRIRVTCPEAFAEEHAPGIISRFCGEHPEIKIDLAPGHGAVDLNRREAEVAIRATKSPPDNCYGRKICDFRFALFASPAYLEDRSDLPLSHHSFCIIDGTIPWLVPQVWKTAEIGEQQTVFQCRASRAVQNAAAAGMGVCFLPCYVGDADDRLVRVSDTFPHLDMEFWVLTHPDLRHTARVRAFMAHLYEELAVLADLFSGATKTWSPTDGTILS